MTGYNGCDWPNAHLGPCPECGRFTGRFYLRFPSRGYSIACGNCSYGIETDDRYPDHLIRRWNGNFTPYRAAVL